ncbi:MAG: hypothetical protein QM610_13430 [Chitinophagaceae bacterium]
MLNSSYYKVAKKVFVNGFYKAHSGALFFLFSVVVFYFFFIGLLDKMPDEKKLSWNLVFARLTLESWYMVGLFALVSVLYTLKSWQYLVAEMYKERNQIIQYGSRCFSGKKLFRYWVWMQLQIMVPLFVYGLFVSGVGLIFHFSVKALFLLVWLCILLLASGIFYLYAINQNADKWQLWRRFWNHSFFRKPLDSLYLWFVVDRLKLQFVLTKSAS